MARTKQTARQSTGDVAPRRSLGKPKGKRQKRKPDDNADYAPSSSAKRKRSCDSLVLGDAVESLAKKRSNPPRAASTRASCPSPSTSTPLASGAPISGPVHAPSSIPSPQTGDQARPSATSAATYEAVNNFDVDFALEDEQRETSGLDDERSECSDSDSEDLEREDEPWEAALYAMPPTVLPVDALEPLIVTDMSNSYCYICQNGANNIRCDECPRIMCLKHAPLIEAVPEHIRRTLHFRCPSCHVHATRDEAGMTPYFGLYNVDPQGNITGPHLDQWTRVVTPAARPQHIQVNTLPIIIMSIRLEGLEEDSCPARLVYDYVKTWFEGPAKKHVLYIDIPFSIRNASQAERYRAKWRDVFAALGPFTNARILTFIYTHSHDDTGDLFFARKMSSSSVVEWWQFVIPPELRQIARTPSNDLTIIVLACGAIVNRVRSREELKRVAEETGALRMFSFGATYLQAVLTAPFFMNYAQRVVLEGMVITDESLVTVFEQSLFLARHTPIWVFWRKTVHAVFDIQKYEWTHPTMRPHGHDIGLQCPACGSLASREGVFADHDVILVVCEKADCMWSKAFAPSFDDKVRMIKIAEHGRWRVSKM